VATLAVSIAGRFAQQAARDAEGEVRARWRRGCYVLFPGERYACVGDASLGCGPLNALSDEPRLPAVGERVRLDLAHAATWSPPVLPDYALPDVQPLRRAARALIPAEGLGCLVLDAHNSLSGHAQPALEAVDRWLVGNALDDEAGRLVGLGPGFTAAGDNYLGGVLVALQQFGRKAQALALWRWLAPRLASTSAISRAHLAAAAEGEGHERLHACVQALCAPRPDWAQVLGQLDAAGWDSLAGVVAVVKLG
jgi:hypothetical protein